MIAKNSKSYFRYLNKLVINATLLIITLSTKKPINDDYSALIEKIETNLKVCKYTVNDRVNTWKYKKIFSKGYTENWSSEKFTIESAFKTNSWKYKVKM